MTLRKRTAIGAFAVVMMMLAALRGPGVYHIAEAARRGARGGRDGGPE